MGKPSIPQPPPAPNPADVISAQAEANRIDQFTPLGSVINTAPTRGQNASMTLSLDPQVQALLDQQLGITGGALDLAQAQQNQLSANQLDLSGVPLPEVGDFTTDFSGDRARVEQAVFDRGAGLLDEHFGRLEDRTRSRLANQGIPVGSEAFADDFALSVADPRREAFTNLARDAVLAGGAEQSRMLGEERATSNTEFAQRDALRNAMIQSLLTERTLPFNEIASLLGQQQVQAPTNFSGFVPPTPIDVTGAHALQQQAFGNQLGRAQLAQQPFNQFVQGLFGLGSAALI